MSEIVEPDSQALNHLLTEAAVDWEGLSSELARQADAQAWVWDGKEEKARRWHLLVRRERGAQSPSHYVLSNAGDAVSLARLARMHACRFFIEHAFREAKSELAAWPTTRCAAGMPGTGTWRWS